MNAPAPARRYALHSALMFLPLFASGMWNVPFSMVLRAHHLEGILAYGFACSALAAIVAPLIVGSMADQQVSPEKILRWLAAGAAVTLAVLFLAIDRGWSGPVVLVAMLAHALCASPMWSLIGSVVLSQLANPGREFAGVRIWGTLGWIASGFTVSGVLRDESSVRVGFVAAGALAVLAVGLWWLPDSPPPDAKAKRRWTEVLGLDALSLLTHRDHRVVFLTAVLFSIPLAAFVPFTPLHLSDLGMAHPAVTMTLGQWTEIVCLLGLGAVLSRFRLKWVFLTPIVLAVIRFALCATDRPWPLLAGIALHGFCYTLFYITAQIYVAERIDGAMRARAQALFFLITSGVGNLAGFLLNGWWKRLSTDGGAVDWTRYWGGLAVLSAAIALYFLLRYHGVYRGLRRGDVRAEPEA